MSVRYVDHPAQTSIDPAADWFPFWNTSSAAAERCIVNNMIASATLPGANLVAGSVTPAKLVNLSANVLMGRYSGGAGPFEEIALTSGEFSLSGGVLSLANSYQPLDSDLTAIAALTTVTFGRALLTKVSASALRITAELLTPSGWGSTDTLVTAHGTDILTDVGANTVMRIIPVSSATNVDVQVRSKGAGTTYLMSGDTLSQFVLSTAQIYITANNTTRADFYNNTLYSADTLLALDWEERELEDASGNPSLNWRDKSMFGSWACEGFTVAGKLGVTPQAVTLTAGAVTFAATSSFVKLTGDSGANTLATITGGVDGMELEIYCVDGLVTFTDTAGATANTFNLSASFTSSAGDIIGFRFTEGKWFERYRSVN